MEYDQKMQKKRTGMSERAYNKIVLANRSEVIEKMMVAVDCVVIGFDGEQLKLMVVKRDIEPLMGEWSLMGGYVQPEENFETAAHRVLKRLTGLDGIYLEQLHAYGNPDRDLAGRTISIAFFALINSTFYEPQIRHDFEAEWFSLLEVPPLVFDHDDMVERAKVALKYKAANHPILFELLPDRFTLPQLQILYESIYEVQFDRRNFSRKVLSTKLLIRTDEKDRSKSKRGAFYYRLDKERYAKNFKAFLNIIPNPNNIL